MNVELKELFGETDALVIKQSKEMLEIALNWETANKYQVLDSKCVKIAFAAERSNGFFHSLIRNFLRAHRPMNLDIFDIKGEVAATGKRPFFFFFSELFVKNKSDKVIGSIKTRFGIIKRIYDLEDANGRVFARITSPRWRLWTFTIFDKSERECGVISKKWGGILKEAFTDADMFRVDLSKKSWSEQEKAVLLFATLCIDLDFFEDNSSSAIDIFD